MLNLTKQLCIDCKKDVNHDEQLINPSDICNCSSSFADVIKSLPDESYSSFQLSSRPEQDFHASFFTHQNLPLSNESKEPEECKLHSNKIKYVCFSDQEKLCSDCGLEKHRDPSGHVIKPIQILDELIRPKLQCFDDLFSRIETLSETTEELYQQQKKTAIDVVQSGFSELLFLLNAKEAEFISEINSFYDREIDRFRSEVGIDSLARQLTVEKIAEYQQIIHSSKPFELLEEDLSVPFLIIKEHTSPEKTLYIEKMLKQITGNIHSTLCTQILSLEKIEVKKTDLTEMWDLRLTQELSLRQELKRYQPISQVPFLIQNAFQSDFIIQENKLQTSYPFKTLNRNNLDLLPRDLESVSSLEFRISEEIEKMEREDILTLSYFRSRFTEIDDIQIIIEACKISDDILTDIFSCLFWRNQNLKSINLQFKMQGVFEKSILFIAQNVLSTSYNLKRFSIYFGKCETTDEACSSLKQSLSRVAQGIEYLFLALNCQNITPDTLQKLFVQMPNLEVFVFQLQSNAFDDKVLQKFVSNTLPSLTKLKKIDLFIQNSRVTDFSVKNLLATFSQTNFLKTLEQLQIGLDHTKITDESLKEFLTESLSKFSTLKTFEIFVSNTQVTSSTKDQILQWKEIRNSL